MNSIFVKTCMRTASSLGARRCKYRYTLQSHRHLSISSPNLVHLSMARRATDGDESNLKKSNTDSDTEDIPSKPKVSRGWSQFSSQKYEKFSESASRIIYDFDEEQLRLEEGLEVAEEIKVKEFASLERGLTGVYDIEELVELLRQENAKDISVIKVPSEMKYVNFMVIVSCKSQRHINALSEYVRKIYKKKKRSKDRYVYIEGKNTGWSALDLGNIALHIMEQDKREDYDLDTLWTVGAQYDEKCLVEEEQDVMDVFNLDFSYQSSQSTLVSDMSATKSQNDMTQTLKENS